MPWKCRPEIATSNRLSIRILDAYRQADWTELIVRGGDRSRLPDLDGRGSGWRALCCYPGVRCRSASRGIIRVDLSRAQPMTISPNIVEMSTCDVPVPEPQASALGGAGSVASTGMIPTAAPNASGQQRYQRGRGFELRWQIGHGRPGGGNQEFRLQSDGAHGAGRFDGDLDEY